MKIWFVADIPATSAGGVARSVHELASGLRQRGHAIRVITRDTVRARNYLDFALRVAGEFCRSLTCRPCWIIARSTDGVFAALIIRLFRLKTGTILYSHGWEEFVYDLEKRMSRIMITAPSTWKARAVRFPLMRLALKLCTVCISGTMAETVRLGAAYPQYKRKFVYLGNGVACGDGPGYWETREARPADFLFVGNTTWKKNLCHAAGVFFLVKKRAPGARLTVVGAGEDVAANHRMGLDGEGIVVIPSVPLDAMGAWYRACPYLLVTSRYEGGHSLAMLEAMTCGCLVFASAIQSNREIVTDGINGVIISGFDAAADADRICTALGSQGQSAMRHEAVETARKHGWESRVLDLEGLLWSR